MPNLLKVNFRLVLNLYLLRLKPQLHLHLHQSHQVLHYPKVIDPKLQLFHVKATVLELRSRPFRLHHLLLLRELFPWLHKNHLPHFPKLFCLYGPNTNIVINGTGANRTVQVAPAANQSGTTTITATGGTASSPSSSPPATACCR